MQLPLTKTVLPAVACALVFCALPTTAAQTEQTQQIVKVTDKTLDTETKSGVQPAFKHYRGIAIGMASDQVREKLEQFLQAKGERQDFFRVSDGETAQVFYDENSKVRAVSVDYIVNNSEPPTPSEVLGVEVKPKSDGSLYARQTYKDAGYWVSYNRTNGDSPLVTITMQVIW